jgi:hypothetical protein
MIVCGKSLNREFEAIPGYHSAIRNYPVNSSGFTARRERRVFDREWN